MGEQGEGEVSRVLAAVEALTTQVTALSATVQGQQRGLEELRAEREEAAREAARRGSEDVREELDERTGGGGAAGAREGLPPEARGDSEAGVESAADQARRQKALFEAAEAAVEAAQEATEKAFEAGAIEERVYAFAGSRSELVSWARKVAGLEVGSAGEAPAFIPFGASSLSADPGQFAWHPRVREYSSAYLRQLERVEDWSGRRNGGLVRGWLGG